MFIQTVDTPNPDSMMFYPQIKLLEEEGSIDFPSLKAAAKSPLARALFTIEGVTGVLFSPEYITLKKDPAVPWTEGAASSLSRSEFSSFISSSHFFFFFFFFFFLSLCRC